MNYFILTIFFYFLFLITFLIKWYTIYIMVRNSKLIRVNLTTLNFLDKLKRDNSYDSLIMNLIKLSCDNVGGYTTKLNEVNLSNDNSIDSLDKLKDEFTTLLKLTKNLNK